MLSLFERGNGLFRLVLDFYSAHALLCAKVCFLVDFRSDTDTSAVMHGHKRFLERLRPCWHYISSPCSSKPSYSGVRPEESAKKSFCCGACVVLEVTAR